MSLQVWSPDAVRQRRSPPGHGSTRPRPEQDRAALAAVRIGEQARYAELYRSHVAGARRHARRLVGPADVEDLVAEAFVKVLQSLVHGKGPCDHFDDYLHVAIRSTAVTFYARAARTELARLEEVDAMALDPSPVGVDAALEGAFRALSPRWRSVLWWTEVEGLGPIEVAAELGITPAAAAALAYRARSGLRAAYRAASVAG